MKSLQSTREISSCNVNGISFLVSLTGMSCCFFYSQAFFGVSSHLKVIETTLLPALSSISASLFGGTSPAGSTRQYGLPQPFWWKYLFWQVISISTIAWNIMCLVVSHLSEAEGKVSTYMWGLSQHSNVLPGALRELKWLYFKQSISERK